MADPGTQQNSLMLGRNKQSGRVEPLPLDDEQRALRVIAVGGEQWRKHSSGQLTGSAAALVTSGRAYKAARLVLANTDSSAVYYATAYVLVGGASTADSQAEFKGYPVLPGGRAEFAIALGNGDVLNGFADTASKITWVLYVRDQN